MPSTRANSNELHYSDCATSANPWTNRPRTWRGNWESPVQSPLRPDRAPKSRMSAAGRNAIIAGRERGVGAGESSTRCTRSAEAGTTRGGQTEGGEGN